MVTTRILINQAGTLYRFLRFEQSSDGSVIVAVDRDSSVSTDGRTLVEGKFVPALSRRDSKVAHARWTVHTSGIVNYRHGNDPATTQRIEPLYALTKNWLVGWVSIPRPSRLTPLDSSRKHAVQGVMTFPPGFTERVTIGIFMCPGPPAAEAGAAWVSINFETYSVVIAPTPPPVEMGDDMSEHFSYGSIGMPPNALKGIGAAEAELKFYETVHGPGGKVFREDGGTYVVLAAVEMAKPPKLQIGFDRGDLSIEIIRSEKQPSHKVRFWILDKGGRNKTDDLRAHIVSIELNARL